MGKFNFSEEFKGDACTLRQTHSGKSVNAVEKENEWDNR